MLLEEGGRYLITSTIHWILWSLASVFYDLYYSSEGSNGSEYISGREFRVGTQREWKRHTDRSTKEREREREREERLDYRWRRNERDRVKRKETRERERYRKGKD